MIKPAKQTIDTFSGILVVDSDVAASRVAEDDVFGRMTSALVFRRTPNVAEHAAKDQGVQRIECIPVKLPPQPQRVKNGGLVNA